MNVDGDSDRPREVGRLDVGQGGSGLPRENGLGPTFGRRQL